MVRARGHWALRDHGPAAIQAFTGRASVEQGFDLLDAIRDDRFERPIVVQGEEKTVLGQKMSEGVDLRRHVYAYELFGHGPPPYPEWPACPVWSNKMTELSSVS